MPFISSRDPLWQQILANTPHDVYHLPGFAAIEAGLLNGEAIAWFHQEQGNTFLIPLVSRTINGGQEFRDLVSPYGYSGMLTLKNIDADEASHALSLFNKEAAANGYVSSFLRLNPLLNSWQLPQTEAWRQWFHGGTVSVMLETDIEVLRRSYSENHRRNLSALSKLQYTTRVNQWQHLPDFMEAYRQTMNRRNAHPYYYFPETYFQMLRNLLGENLMLISVYDAEGKWTAGGLFTRFGDVMQYHLGATRDEYLSHSPSKLMLDRAIVEGKQNGSQILHLGGGLGGSTTDGLFRFKKGFALKYHPYTSLRFIHLPSVYEKLRAALGKGYNRNTYFPEYRVVIEE
jgi:hypothetical protein